jgi:ParB family chromosome partitioning protein
MPPEKSTRRLGRGLDALFNSAGSAQATPDTQLRDLAIAQISANPFQPRKSFSDTELKELQESLDTNGLLQPVTVRPSAQGKGYELVAGERRLRAARNLGWKEIPAVVKELSDREMLTMALVENLQRFDLNPIEEAEGYDRLIREFNHTQQSVATMVGKDRSTVANAIRILNLPDSIRSLIQEGKLTQGQSRPLLGLEDEKQAATLARQIVAEGWSAREVERRVRDLTGKSSSKTKGKGTEPTSDAQSAEIRNIEQLLRKHLQTDVSIQMKPGNRGALVVEFYSPEDLERLLETIGISRNPH